MELKKIAFGGGCHWCTEAVFQSLKGVEDVKQGFIASEGKNNTFSEAVIVSFTSEIELEVLVEIHLRTHKSTSKHTMRKKYRSAVYYFTAAQKEQCLHVLQELQNKFDAKIITEILAFKEFKPSNEAFQNYYLKNPKKPFCETYINPKLKLLLNTFSNHVNVSKISNTI
ncbi:peptide-methionine (S)-S-oxide reductase [Polaribacter tangerinus]|uniref:peptide-methionine (S)-S-oxide reductase n=1 Tax=Polaribacter tangerinus TaxID=1920034 RepID=UPI000B4BB1BE|nr:peptide-methionine (S)-S-oxide reductase [Polaribacter tangerinus]